MKAKPPAGLVQTPADLFRRQHKKTSFVLARTLKQHAAHIVVCLLIVCLHIGFLHFKVFQRFDFIFFDGFLKSQPVRVSHPDIAYIEITEDSLQGIGRWPWPRRYHAALTHILTEWGAQAVVFDILFSEPSEEAEEDLALYEAIKESGRVYLPRVRESHQGKDIWIQSLPMLEKAARGIGHINIFPDSDGVVRRVKPFLSIGNETMDYLPLKVAADLTGQDLTPSRKLFPTDEHGDLVINWTGKWTKSFEHYSFLDVIRSFEAIRNGRKPVLDPIIFKGKICIIGLTAVGQSDIKASPLEPTYPSVGFHANTMNNLLLKDYLREASSGSNLKLLIAISCLAIFFFVFLRSGLAAFVGLALALGWVGIAYYIFSTQRIWVSIIYPLSSILLLYVTSGLFHFYTERKEQKKLFQLAVNDGLTGLYVIRYFRELLNQICYESRKMKTPLCIVLFDVDHFKKVNDTYGHAAGDLVLKEIAKIVKISIRNLRPHRQRDIAARYGGEEFIICLRECPIESAVFKVAERLRTTVQAHSFIYEGTRIPVTISLGVAKLRDGENVPDKMILRADAALYRAKENGRNQTCLESEEGAESPAKDPRPDSKKV